MYMLCSSHYFVYRYVMRILRHTCYTYIYIYIIGHYNSSVKIIDLVSHTTYVVHVDFIHKWQTTDSLKSTPNDRVFEKLFIAILFTLRLFARNLLRGNRRRNTFRISFEVWPGTRTLTFCLISQHITY